MPKLSSFVVPFVITTGLAVCYISYRQRKRHGIQRYKNGDTTVSFVRPQNLTQQTLQAEFEKASSFANSTSFPNISDVEKLLLYALYKQVTCGDRDRNKDVEKPSKLNFVANAKYDAWGKCCGMPKEIAMLRYIDCVYQFSQGIREKGNSSNFDDNADIVYSDDDGEPDTDDEDSLCQNDGNNKNFSSFGMGMMQSTPAINIGEDGKTEDDSNSCSALHKAVLNNDTNTLCSLIESPTMTTGNNGENININEPDELGQTPLHFAADRGSIECVQLLLSAGADPNVCDKDGISIIQAAVISDHVEIVKVLLDAGADADKMDIDGESARMCAMDGGSDSMKELFL